ncbi:hypothetical protein LINGRAHAP2_LOCUS6852 [Linum grandiflorum]
MLHVTYYTLTLLNPLYTPQRRETSLYFAAVHVADLLVSLSSSSSCTLFSSAGFSSSFPLLTFASSFSFSFLASSSLAASSASTKFLKHMSSSSSSDLGIKFSATSAGVILISPNSSSILPNISCSSTSRIQLVHVIRREHYDPFSTACRPYPVYEIQQSR